MTRARGPGGMTDEEIVRALNELIAVDRHAVAGYELALGPLRERPELTRGLLGSQDDHDRHVRELSVFVRRHGGLPALAPEGTAELPPLWRRLGEATGLEALLDALTAAESEAAQRYQAGVRHPWPPAVRDAVERALADERRHVAACEEARERLRRTGGDAGPAAGG